MKIRYLPAACVILAFSLSGCAYKSFTYPSDYNALARLYEKPKYDLAVAVMPLIDGRVGENSIGTQPLAWIPLLPYVSWKFEKPELAVSFLTIDGFEFHIAEDLARAIVASLKMSNLFRDVYFYDGGDLEKVDLVIKGVSKSSAYEGKAYTYGLSVACPILWVVGAPVGSSANHLQVEIKMYSKQMENPIWEYEFTKEKTIKHSFYRNWAKDIIGFTVAMEEGMNEVIRDMDKKLSAIPAESLKR